MSYANTYANPHAFSGWLRRFQRRAGRKPVLSVHRGVGAPRHHERLWRWQLLSRGFGDPGTDGGLPVENVGVQRLHAAPLCAGSGDVQRRAGLKPVLPVDRGAGAARHYGRLWRWQLLSLSFGDPRTDGGLPGPDVLDLPVPVRTPAAPPKRPSTERPARSTPARVEQPFGT